MAETADYEQMIAQHIPDARATVSGGGGKFEATVISDAFDGCNMLARHRLVYAALDAKIKSGEIHAVSIRAYTPAEWERVGGED